MTPLGFLSVGVGAMLGAWLRWALAWYLNPLWPNLPLGTWLANLGGGFLIGAALAWFAAHPLLDPNWKLVVITGFLGALTTFSSFSAESLTLIQQGRLGWAALHSGAHLFGCLAAAALGFKIAQA